MSDIHIKVGNLYASIKSLKSNHFLAQNHYHSHDGNLFFFKENLNPTKNLPELTQHLMIGITNEGVCIWSIQVSPTPPSAVYTVQFTNYRV